MKTEKRILVSSQLLRAGVMIIAVLSLCSCCVSVSSTSGSRSKDLEAEYTDEQWLEMVTHREHQVRYTWMGLSRSHMGRGSWGMSLDGIAFKNTEANILEHQHFRQLINRPLLFLPLFDSQDPEVVLTGIYFYQQGDLFDCEIASQVAAALRKSLKHADTRIRYAALETLFRRSWLGVEDVRAGLDDDAVIMQNTTTTYLSAVMRQRPLGDQCDPQWTGINTNERLIEIKRELAPILLDHLDDTSFFVRTCCANDLCQIIQDSSGNYPIGRPPRFEWAQHGWQERVDMKEQWEIWWAEYGEEAIRLAK